MGSYRDASSEHDSERNPRDLSGGQANFYRWNSTLRGRTPVLAPEFFSGCSPTNVL